MKKLLVVAAVVSAFLVGYLLSQKANPQVVICENGSFEPQLFNPNDPYLREKAICNLTDSNGPSVTVLLID